MFRVRGEPLPEEIENRIQNKGSLKENLKTTDKLQIKCDNGHTFERQVRILLVNSDCPVCKRRKQFEERYRKVREESRYSNPPEDLSREEERQAILQGKVKTTDRLHFLCSKHGEYLQAWNRHLDGNGCPKCGHEVGAKKHAKQVRANRRIPQWVLDDMVTKEIPNSTADKVTFRCDLCGQEYSQRLADHINGSKCPLCNRWSSRIEDEICETFKDQNPRRGVRDLIRGSSGRWQELDIVFDKQRVAIEVNGLYWHSEGTMETNHGYGETPQTYHLLKTERCEEIGYQLIHIFEDDWRDRKQICINLIKAKLGLLERTRIPGRKTTIRQVETREATDFMRRNHIQGPGRGKAIGCYQGDKLLSLIQIRPALTNTSDIGSTILDRYCSDPSYFVIGGFEKLLRHVEKEEGIKRWVTYADRTISSGSLYEHTGWRRIATSKPDYKYVVKTTRVHKFNYRIKRFKEDPELLYEEGLTEQELAQLNNIPRIWDSGKHKYELITQQGNKKVPEPKLAHKERRSKLC